MSILTSLDLFSCVGCHALGFERAGIRTVALCEIDTWRQSVLADHFSCPIYEDVRSIRHPPKADIVFGGPPCKRTSLSAAVIGRRDGDSLWPEMFRIGLAAGAEWIVVEQPPGNKAWEATVQGDLAGAGYHVARFEFAAYDVGAPYQRRRVYTVGCASLSRLAVARFALPQSITDVARAAVGRNDWGTGELAVLPVVARAAGDMDKGPRSALRRKIIEALGDSNPPQMAEALGRAIRMAHDERISHSQQ